MRGVVRMTGGCYGPIVKCAQVAHHFSSFWGLKNKEDNLLVKRVCSKREREKKYWRNFKKCQISSTYLLDNNHLSKYSNQIMYITKFPIFYGTNFYAEKSTYWHVCHLKFSSVYDIRICFLDPTNMKVPVSVLNYKS